MLSAEHISWYLHSTWAGQRIVYMDVTGSTNNDAGGLAQNGAPGGTLVVADRQDSGRGSRGRSWSTPSGSNIAMSIIVRPDAPPAKVPMLTLVMGLSVAEGVDLSISEMVPGDRGRDCFIKWPNDIVIGGRKICGILTELHMNPDNTISDVVIGVGINVTMVDFPDEIKNTAGSILSQTGVRVDRSLVVARCMERFEENYGKYEETYDLSLLREQYEDRLLNKGERVKILDPGGEFEATAYGITDGGSLVIKPINELPSGSSFACNKDGVIEINAGEVSVRGLYGYV